MSLEIIEEISKWVADNTSLVLGDTLQAGTMPVDAPDRAVSFQNSAGGAVFSDLVSRMDYQLQVLARAPNYNQARDDSVEVFDFLHSNGGVLLPEITPTFGIEHIRAMAFPQKINIDEKGREWYSTNFTIFIFKL